MSDISLTYRFNDFTLNNYIRLLKLAKKSYKFSFFDNDLFLNRTILLRHDVEFSVPIALKIAKIEHELGIRSTYFVQLHSEFYNALEKRTFTQLKEIESLGHCLELHFDAHFWGVENEVKLEKYLRIDAGTFATYFDKRPKIFSFHNTNKFTLSCEKDSYADMINVYAKKYKQVYAYCADSTGYWRYEILEDMLIEAKEHVLQLLIHDGMWQDEILPPRRRIHKVIDEHSSFMKKHYDEVLQKLGAKNIDWEGEV